MTRKRELRAQLIEAQRDLATAVKREAALTGITKRINEHPLDVDGTLVAIAEAARELTAVMAHGCG